MTKRVVLSFTIFIIAYLTILAVSQPAKTPGQLRAECGQRLYHLEYKQVDSLATLLMKAAEQE